ncbi:hypothetical protein BDP27DRAFT_1418324 [Rhodocollybia butyracea]|uniref:Uncharacterized protein n=1 Tax=Rhodocollybia butyracea TaxID=206335 RepID=A0A9P5PZS5_9AGAR|nr:hypothetical protein BDP27DRAFT_1418324 [Rhodocollybia butyracea]
MSDIEVPYKLGQSCAIGGDKNQFIIYENVDSPPPSKRRRTNEEQVPSDLLSSSTQLSTLSNSSDGTPTPEPDAVQETNLRETRLRLRETELDLQQYKAAYKLALSRPPPEVKALKARVRDLETQLESKDEELQNSEANNDALRASADYECHENNYRNMEFRHLQKVLAETREDLAKAKATLAMSARLAFVLTSPSVHAENPERIQEKVDQVIKSLEAAHRELENAASCA